MMKMHHCLSPESSGSEPFINVFWNTDHSSTVYRVNINIEYTNSNPLNVTPAYFPESNIYANYPQFV